MSIDWGTIASVGIGAAIGTAGSICTTCLAHRFSRQREQDAFRRHKDEHAAREQNKRAERLGSLYIKALEAAYLYRACLKRGLEKDHALDQAKYHEVKAELDLICRDESLIQAWKDYFFQPIDDRKAGTERKRSLIRLMNDRLSTVADSK